MKEETVAKSWSPVPPNFGQHPDFDLKAFQRDAVRGLRKKTIDDVIQTINERNLPISELFNPLHPDVFIIPRNRFTFPVDEWGDEIGFERTIFPFSSTDFYTDIDEEGSVFYEICRNDAFHRLGGISQLGYLVPPRPKEWNKNVSVSYVIPQFHHTRWIHSLLTAIIMEIVLARNGFSKKERASVVLTAGSHDIATPAGGDSVKRVDPEKLGEEESFAWVLKYYGLDKKWKKQFGFNLVDAERWVAGEEAFGQLLDFIDKISYTALDCFHLGEKRKGKVRNFCLKHPLVMDVWQDIIAPDGKNFIFSNPENLFNFLLLRAYEFQEFLYSPYSRALDLFIKKMVQPLYRKGIITREQLLTRDDDWLYWTLQQYYPEEIKCIINPGELSWKKFKTEKEQKMFCRQLGRRLDHAEQIVKFNTGLDFPVLSQGRVIPLREAIPQEKVKLLEKISASMMGYYVYYLHQSTKIPNVACLQI